MDVVLYTHVIYIYQFASHQIFHVMVFIGMSAFYVAVEQSRRFWLDESNMQICQSL